MLVEMAVFERKPRSPPTRGRELKRVLDLDSAVVEESPPTRGRELKQPVVVGDQRVDVAPHAGA